MMKRLLSLLLMTALLLPVSAVLADPLPLLEDYTGTAEILYEEGNPDGGRFVYTYRYPHVDESAEGGAAINSFFDYRVKDTQDFDIPINSDSYLAEGINTTITVTYTVTCNNDDYFSVLVHRTTESDGDIPGDTWEGDVFVREGGSAGLTCTLPQLLGILAADENDTWLQDRQTEKAEKLIREFVWDQIRDNENDIDFYPDLTEEDLEHYFFPEQDFYLDETGNPVFFLQVGIAAPEEAGLISFPIPLEDILDEL